MVSPNTWFCLILIKILLTFLSINRNISWDVPVGSVVKNPPANAGDMGSISGSGRSLGEGNGNPL